MPMIQPTKEHAEAVAKMLVLKKHLEAANKRLAAAEKVCEAAVKLDSVLTELGLASLGAAQEMHDAIHEWRKEHGE